MTHILTAIATTAMIFGAQATADAATKKIRVPAQFDGSWTITAVTNDGPCSASTSYQVQIKGSDASIPGDEIDIAGGVSTNGAVRATITKGSNTVPIIGRLKRQGVGTGTWRTSGGLVACGGSWNARRAG
ncbi:heme utilization protein [Methylobacterium haplocladii]|uniref:heme utilization protein n=1 Tax=Methylobacterium haplocladii TaxID=1176176 RepID=UPI001EDEBADE|nr:heme utilization protein [Methylobacterium haplocladii]GJD82330.1 hypothetical protein HPGCJGGD_0182 [Methylobacterium haplocladii]GLS61555.1 hypothetical protein GCM10007887_42790 [Methylobacterium haplocladii]